VAKVVAAMSGGVDSAVAAALCAQAGHEVLGVTLKLFEPGGRAKDCCGASRDANDARRAAERIGIRHRVLDMSEVFSRSVVEPFVEAYLSLRTPNPCVECNRSVKFGALLELARSWKADFVATGHYARILRKEDGSLGLFRGGDAGKDQSYFLYSLTQAELSRTLFPLGGLTKTEVRAQARALGLGVAEKPESMEVCFVPKDDYRAFLRSRAGKAARRALEPGDIRDLSGRRLGAHQGLAGYTPGQRRGLGISSSRPLYVSRLDGESNTLIVGTGEQSRRSAFRVGRVSWTGAPPPARTQVRIRHRGRLLAASWRSEDDRILVELLQGVRGVAPGQAAVFCSCDEVLGGGTIEEVL